MQNETFLNNLLGELRTDELRTERKTTANIWLTAMAQGTAWRRNILRIEISYSAPNKICIFDFATAASHQTLCAMLRFEQI
jgi:hypothetical protein